MLSVYYHVYVQSFQSLDMNCELICDLLLLDYIIITVIYIIFILLTRYLSVNRMSDASENSVAKIMSVALSKNVVF